ncbi:MAG: DUF2934 domain-containing protein [Terriglobales bacterium]|jgi:hypothetical protein
MALTPTTTTTSRATSRPTESTGELQERIRRRAYELYEQRGKTAGHEMDDWLQAELEMAHGTSNKIAA